MSFVGCRNPYRKNMIWKKHVYVWNIFSIVQSKILTLNEHKISTQKMATNILLLKLWENKFNICLFTILHPEGIRVLKL